MHKWGSSYYFFLEIVYVAFYDIFLLIVLYTTFDGLYLSIRISLCEIFYMQQKARTLTEKVPFS